MKHRNTFLGNDELQILALLRVKRDFMTLMQEKHARARKKPS